MSKPFHLSVVVPDLDATRFFYTTVLGCSIGRDAGTWADILLFGHQLTLHQQSEHMPAVAIDHFGPVLSKTEWLDLSRRIASHQVPFQLEPQIRDNGSEGEAGKFLIKDPAGNILEFKYYASFNNTVGDAGTE